MVLFGHTPQIIFVIFSQNGLAAKMNIYSVSCACISSYSFMWIPLELYRCLGNGLNMCILFGHNPQIIFCYFFHKMNSVIFATKVNRY